MSQCSMKDKETKALKYTITGVPDAPSIWGTKEKKIENNHPPTFPWEHQHKPRHPLICVCEHSVHTARGGDCPTGVGVRAVTSQILCCMASSGQWFNSPACRAALEGPILTSLPVLSGSVGLCTYTQLYRLTPASSHAVQAHFSTDFKLIICLYALVD